MKKHESFKKGKLIITIMFALIALLAITIFLSNIVIAKAVDVKVYEDKIYHQIDENRDYDGDKVLVVLDKNISGLNKIHKTELFGDFPKSEIIDLTASKNNSEQKKDDFRQIFEIVLPENNKQKVKEALINLLN